MDDFISTNSKINSNITLLEDEELLFQDEVATLTNKRLLTDFKTGVPKNSVEIKLFDGVRQIDGGQENRIRMGIKAFVFGVILSSFQFLLDYFFISDNNTTQLIRIFNTLLFVIGAVSVGSGIYLIITSLLRIKPHTTLIFVRFKGKDIKVTFSNRNDPKALKLKRLFLKQQRSFKL